MSDANILSENFHFFKHVKRSSIKITKDMYCSYRGDCSEYLDSRKDLCLYCRYRVPIDIPKMLKGYKHE